MLRVHATAELPPAAGSVARTASTPREPRSSCASDSQVSGRAALTAWRRAWSCRRCSIVSRHGRDAPWFVSGLQDYFGGFGFRNGKLERKPHADQLAIARADLRAERTIALVDLVLMTRAEFDGGNTWGSSTSSVWAEGWAFMWFLMTADGATIDGPGVVARYVAKWKEKRDPAAATRAAFEGVDWDALELEWRAFVDGIKG